MMDWHYLLTAIALMLILEGISPFIAPSRMKTLARFLLEADEKSIRIIGFVSMAIGLVILYLLRIN